MFVCRDCARPSLTPLYDGPYRVVHHSDAYFRLAICDREDSVSVSRLKSLLAEGPVAGSGGAMCFSKSDPIESSIQDFYKIFIFAIGRPFKRQLTLIVISMPGAYVCIQCIVCIVIVKKKNNSMTGSLEISACSISSFLTFRK